VTTIPEGTRERIRSRGILPRRLAWAIAFSPVAYCAGSYLYWPVLKVLGTLAYGSFHFEDTCEVVHGGMPFPIIVLFSPVTLPLHLLFTWSEEWMAWVWEYSPQNHDRTSLVTLMPSHGQAVVWTSFFIAMGLSYLGMWLAWRAIQGRRLRRSSDSNIG